MSIIGLVFVNYLKSETIYIVDVSAESHFHFFSGVDFYIVRYFESILNAKKAIVVYHRALTCDMI